MRSSKKKIILIGFIFIVGFGIYYSYHTRAKSELTASKSAHSLDKIEKNKNEVSPSPIKVVSIPIEELSEFKNVSEIEKKSLVVLTSLIDEALDGQSSLNYMIQKLDQLNLKPLVMKESNPVTGSLDIVRTKETLPGTRYFHAQYFTSEDGSNFLQHVSFEFAGGIDSFNLLKKVVQKQFAITSAPSMENKKFISWNVNGRSVWIKKMDTEDLTKKSPFNAYDVKNDIGTIRFGSEAEIH